MFAGNVYGQRAEKQAKEKAQSEVKMEKAEGKEFGQARVADARAVKRARAKRERVHKRTMAKKGR